MFCRQAHAEKAPFACRLLVQKKNYTLLRARTLTPEVRCVYVELQQCPGNVGSAVEESTFPRSPRSAAAEPIGCGIAGN